LGITGTNELLAHILNLAEQPGDATIAAARRIRRHHHHQSPRPAEFHRCPEPKITKTESATAPPATSPSNRAASCRCTDRPIEQAEQHRAAQSRARVGAENI
jgi:hypothetical protein